MDTINERKRVDLNKIFDGLGQKSGYGCIRLTPDGVRGCMGKRTIDSESYLAFWGANKERHFLGCNHGVVSFDPDNNSEVKKVTLLVRNTDKAQRAYIASTTDINATGTTGKTIDSPEYANMYQSLTESSNDFSFFLLISFSEDDRMTGFHFYSNAEFPIPLYSYSLIGNPPMSELKDFFTLLFTIFTDGLERQQQYWAFLRTMLEEESD